MMTEFDQEIKDWIDYDGLVGNKKNPEKWSTGNAILETAFAYQIAKERTSFRWMHALEESVLGCFQKGVLNKNPGRTDQITHDDIVGFCSINPQLADLVCQWGNKTGWVLSNTGENYFTANVKPWHRAFYLAASSSNRVSVYDGAIFWAAAILGVFTSSYSGVRLWWLMINTNPPYPALKSFWNTLFKLRHGSLKKVQTEYYDTINHINVKYCAK